MDEVAGGVIVSCDERVRDLDAMVPGLVPFSEDTTSGGV